MEAARRITTDSELSAITAAGSGFIIDPFNRRWHRVGCPQILKMTVAAAKWFAPTPGALAAFLEQRHARYVTAKPIMRCAGWCDRSGAPSERRATSPSPRTGQGDRVPRPPCVRNEASGFAVWADERVCNESKASSSAGRLRRSIIDGIRALPEPAGRVLHASYGGRRWPGTDVENLLFNNIDQMLSLFTVAGSLGVRFEDLGATVTPAPDGTSWPCFYSYRMVQPGALFIAVEAERLVCHVREAVIPDGPARLAARVWLAVCRTRPRPGIAPPLQDGDYMLRIAVRGLHPARNIKALVDGVTAAMQRDDPDRVTSAMTRLSPLLSAGTDELVALATTPDAPLGSRSRPNPSSKESLFTLDGTTQVRVTPDDDRCIAAEVLASPHVGPPSIAVEAHAAKRRPQWMSLGTDVMPVVCYGGSEVACL